MSAIIGERVEYRVTTSYLVDRLKGLGRLLAINERDWTALVVDDSGWLYACPVSDLKVLAYVKERK
jgi:hypothetical protein